MTKNNKKTGFVLLRPFRRNRLIGAGLAAALLIATPLVYADTIQQQIDNLSNQNSQKQQTVNTLQLQAGSYQNAIITLQQQINAIEAAIEVSTEQQAKLQQEIITDQQQIDQKKQQLSNTIKTMYIDGQTSTIEELASSKNLSDYVDKQEYHTVVQNQLDDTIKQIGVLQQQQQSQKTQVDQLLGTQKQQQGQLDSDEQQQASLLSYNQGQQDQYNQQISANKTQISSLQAEQARINAQNSRTINIQASGGSGGYCDNGHGNGGYPMVWCNAGLDAVTTSGGFPSRECTSFAYWYFTSVEGKSLSVTGNANQWIYTANRPVDQTPEDGAIAVSTAGPFGHVLIVLATPGQSYGGVTAPAGYVITMSMNYDFQGHFIVDERAAGSLYYIH